MNEQSNYPNGWDKTRVDEVLDHYESQTEEEAIAEDESVYENPTHTFVDVPNEVLPAVRELLAQNSS